MKTADRKQAELKQRQQFESFEKSVSDKAKEVFNTPPYYSTSIKSKGESYARAKCKEKAEP